MDLKNAPASIIGAASCGNCKFGFQIGTAGNGLLCRRFPPVIQLFPMVRPEEMKHAANNLPLFFPAINFPRVMDGDYCGEHKHKIL